MQFDERYINIDSKLNKATYFTTKILVTNLIRQNLNEIIPGDIFKASS